MGTSVRGVPLVSRPCWNVLGFYLWWLRAELAGSTVSAVECLSFPPARTGMVVELIGAQAAPCVFQFPELTEGESEEGSSVVWRFSQRAGTPSTGCSMALPPEPYPVISMPPCLTVLHGMAGHCEEGHCPASSWVLRWVAGVWAPMHRDHPHASCQPLQKVGSSYVVSIVCLAGPGLATGLISAAVVRGFLSLGLTSRLFHSSAMAPWLPWMPWMSGPG